MRHEIDPAVMAALLGKGQFARRRWRPCWWRISFLAFTVGFWGLVAWAVSAFLGARG
jgi:hypothetical protein